MAGLGSGACHYSPKQNCEALWANHAVSGQTIGSLPRLHSLRSAVTKVTIGCNAQLALHLFHSVTFAANPKRLAYWCAGGDVTRQSSHGCSVAAFTICETDVSAVDALGCSLNTSSVCNGIKAVLAPEP